MHVLCLRFFLAFVGVDFFTISTFKCGAYFILSGCSMNQCQMYDNVCLYIYIYIYILLFSIRNRTLICTISGEFIQIGLFISAPNVCGIHLVPWFMRLA